MNDAIVRVRLACPRCGVELTSEIVGALDLHRCGSCGGVWLDPETFRASCEADLKAPDHRSATVSSGARDASRRADPVRYLSCPVCNDAMSRVNFARVSGVILDVCRPHGAWFDAGELRAVRRFVRGSGLRQFARRRELDAERERRRFSPVGSGGGSAGIDLIDVLAGIPDPWGVPSTRTPARWFLRAGVLAVIGGAALWSAFDAHGPRGAAALAGGGCMALIAAYRAFARGLEGRSAKRAS